MCSLVFVSKQRLLSL